MPPKRAQQVFSHAKPIRGQDSSKYRQDPYGNKISLANYGNYNKRTGWEIDHIRPASRGGSNSMQNLQALSCDINRSKGNSLVKKSRHKN